jgi:hypothetical protein
MAKTDFIVHGLNQDKDKPQDLFENKEMGD